MSGSSRAEHCRRRSQRTVEPTVSSERQNTKRSLPPQPFERTDHTCDGRNEEERTLIGTNQKPKELTVDDADFADKDWHNLSSYPRHPRHPRSFFSSS